MTQTLNFHSASREEKLTLFANVHDLWPHADDPKVHLLKRSHSVQHARAEWFVGAINGEIVTGCGAYPLTLYGPSDDRQARGFGAVFTSPQHRGKGYAQALIEFVMDYYRQRGVVDFILYSDISPAYYEKMGFHLLPSWEWSLAAEPLPEGSHWELQSIPVIAENPGEIGCKFGIKRSAEDDVWVLAKQNFPLHKTRLFNNADSQTYWIVSYRFEQTYYLLESNIPQDAEHWQLFKMLVAAACAKANCTTAKGWWSSPPSNSISEIAPRKDGILMWTSGLKDRDPWLPAIQQNGFRTFLSEQF